MVVRYAALPSCASPARDCEGGANFGVLFTVWDRLFGTYVDSEQVDLKGPYGIQETIHPVRMAVGI